MSFKIKGMDKFEREIKQLSKNAQAVSGTHKYSFDEIFSEKFMCENSNFSSIEDFLKSSPENISTAEELEKADETILDIFVSNQTKFSSWKEMMSAAAKILIMKKLGF